MLSFLGCLEFRAEIDLQHSIVELRITSHAVPLCAGLHMGQSQEQGRRGGQCNSENAG